MHILWKDNKLVTKDALDFIPSVSNEVIPHRFKASQQKNGFNLACTQAVVEINYEFDEISNTFKSSSKCRSKFSSDTFFTQTYTNNNGVISGNCSCTRG